MWMVPNSYVVCLALPSHAIRHTTCIPTFLFLQDLLVSQMLLVLFVQIPKEEGLGDGKESARPRCT